MSKCRVLIIDDSAYNRTTLARLIGAEPEFEVVGTAADGEDGLRQMLQAPPDLITLDLDMPRMDGFTFLRIVMQKMPVPVIIVSSQGAAENVFKALELGAVDFVVKPTRNISERLVEVAEPLLQKLRTARGSRVVAPKPMPKLVVNEMAAQVTPRSDVLGLVVIGASTGGPSALQQMISNLPLLPVALLVAQHMPAGFTKAFAARLDRATAYQVAEAEGGEKLQGGSIWIAPGGRNMIVRKRPDGLALTVQAGGGLRFVPNVDELFLSAAAVFGPRVLGVVMTGMGDDGARGAVAVRQAGGALFVESEETTVVNGMPREAARLAGAHRILPLGDLARAIEGWSRTLPVKVGDI
jgi:two-component system, chemotaxis family, protein-glutamate methylesterase/glutaminase